MVEDSPSQSGLTEELQAGISVQGTSVLVLVCQSLQQHRIGLVIETGSHRMFHTVLL